MGTKVYTRDEAARQHGGHPPAVIPSSSASQGLTQAEGMKCVEVLSGRNREGDGSGCLRAAPSPVIFGSARATTCEIPLMAKLSKLRPSYHGRYRRPLRGATGQRTREYPWAARAGTGDDGAPEIMVGSAELESATFCVSSRRSNQLSYEPHDLYRVFNLVLIGLSLFTPRCKQRALTTRAQLCQISALAAFSAYNLRNLLILRSGITSTAFLTWLQLAWILP